jgi:anti-sigma factor RsiW
MNHDPEQLAAAYLTTMRPRARRRFEDHLLACESCWAEVCLGRRGRELAESGLVLAPPQLRDDIRAAVAATTLPAAGRALMPRIVHATAAAAAVVALAGAAALMRLWLHSVPVTDSGTPRTVIAAAVASYRADRLPGTVTPAGTPPELTPLSLRLTGSAAGRLNGIPVTMFDYSTGSGARLTIVQSSQPFPEAAEAHELGGPEGAWTIRSTGVTVICAQHTHTMLLLSSDASLARQVSWFLHAI